jgi:hypothetical protein
LNIFHCFSFCTGLRVNLDKNEAIWVPSGLGSDNKLLPVKHLAWNTSGKFKLLGIHFNLYKEDKTFENYGEKIKKGKEYLKLMGIQVIKTLAILLLVQILTILPNHPAQDMKEIKDIFNRFLWDGKPDNIKTNVINNYEEVGG